MDYTELAGQFLQYFNKFRKNHHQKAIDETLGGEAFVLLYIWRKSSYVLPSEVSNEMCISSARMAAILNALENKGLVIRQIDREDRRRILVSLTRSGEAAARELSQKALNSAVHMLEMLGERDANEFVRIMGRLVDLAPEITNLE